MAKPSKPQKVYVVLARPYEIDCVFIPYLNVPNFKPAKYALSPEEIEDFEEPFVLAFEENIYIAFSHYALFSGQIICGMSAEKFESGNTFNLVSRQRLKIVEILENCGIYQIVEAVALAPLPSKGCSRSPETEKNELQLIKETQEILKEINLLLGGIKNISRHAIPPEVFKKYTSLGDFSDLAAAHFISLLSFLNFEGINSFDRLFNIFEQDMFLSELDPSGRIKILQRALDRTRFFFEEVYIKSGLKIPTDSKGKGGDDMAAEMPRDPYDEWKDKISALNLPGEPPEIRAKATKAVESLKYFQPGHHEFEAVIKYLELIESVPWNQSTQDSLDINQAREVLENDHAYLEKQKQRILEYLSVKKLKPDYGGQILCFIGPPGTGKTSLGQSIARAMGRKFVRRSLGGMHDEGEIRGHRRTYIGALTGQIIQGLIDAGVNNPVFMLDEIDKVSNMTGLHGNPMSALLEVLDPKQNHAFRDNCLDLPFDLSKVLFIATGNTAEMIHPALFDRMEIIPTEAYTTLEKLHIAQKYLLPGQIAAVGLKPEQVIVAPDALEDIARFYTQETGVRQMEREITALCRRVAVEVARGNDGPHEITAHNLHQFLGVRKYIENRLEENLPPGVAIGLAVSALGEGHILYIEAKECPLKFVGPETKGMLCTGSLRDVMSESALVARTRVAAYLSHLSNAIDEKGIHLHIPSGAVPKDGPSAGVAIAVALASLLKNEPVKEKIAFTGEITLRGAILPVDGIKQKVIGAKIAGIKEVVMPADNQRDFAEIHPDFKAGLKVHFVKTIEEVFDIAFKKKEKKERKKR